MSVAVRYVCHRCGTVHSIEEYQKSLFCRICGTFLRRKHTVAKQPFRRIQKKDKTGLGNFFPYADFRPYQRDAIDFASKIIKKGQVGLLSSPCGTGKSISVLTAYFRAKQMDDSLGRLLVLTRTRNQLEIYCRELKRIKQHSGISFAASVFKSKKEMCPEARKNWKLRDISYRDFLQYCRNLREGTFGKTCEYYERTYRGRKPSLLVYNIVNKIKEVGPLLPDEVYNICVNKRLCPHEVTKVMAKRADIIVGNYNYILVNSVRESIFGGTGIKVEDVNCIFDEAHSLPGYAVGILSDELSSISIERAQREVETFGVDDFGFLEALHHGLLRLGRKVEEEFGINVEHVIGVDEIVEPLLETLEVDVKRLVEIFSELSELGENVRYKRAEAGRNPISYLARCVDFLSDWVDIKGSSYARYVNVEVGSGRSRRVRLGIKCLDPALAASVINELRSAILMSGTLWQTDYYIDVLGIERNRCRDVELPSPFPRENRLILVDESVTTKFEKRSVAQWKRIANHLQKIVGQINGRVAVYFPSYQIMFEVAEAADFDLPCVIEERGTKIVDLLRFLKAHEKCIVFGVARGKISEGVDMSIDGRSMLSAVVVVGLPYPKKTELQIVLVKYFREKFGNKAMEYANGIPCLNALAQSAGRLLRSPEDKGIIVMMDMRAVGRFKQKFPKDWRDDMKSHYNIEKILESIRSFITENA